MKNPHTTSCTALTHIVLYISNSQVIFIQMYFKLYMRSEYNLTVFWFFFWPGLGSYDEWLIHQWLYQWKQARDFLTTSFTPNVSNRCTNAPCNNSIIHAATSITHMAIFSFSNLLSFVPLTMHFFSLTVVTVDSSYISFPLREQLILIWF